MNGLTPRQLRGLFWVVEINLVCWLGVSFDATGFPSRFPILPTAIPGLIVAIALQHWAYYNLFRRAKSMVGKEGTEPSPGN